MDEDVRRAGALYRDLTIAQDKWGRYAAAGVLFVGGLGLLTLLVSWWFGIALGMVVGIGVWGLVRRVPTRTRTFQRHRAAPPLHRDRAAL